MRLQVNSSRSNSMQISMRARVNNFQCSNTRVKYKHDENGCKNVNYHYKVPILCPTGVEKGLAPNREAILESLARMTSYAIYSEPRTGNFLPRISHPNLVHVPVARKMADEMR